MKLKYIEYDSVFEKKFKKYVRQLTDSEKQRLKRRLEIFKADIFDKRLKTHKLKGELRDYYAFSLNYSQRIIFQVRDSESVYFIDIGSHDVCY